MISSVKLPDGTMAPSLGQGTWRMGEGQRSAKAEADALRLGLDLGMGLIDTAEMYGDGASEEVVGQAIAGRRQDVFVVSKVYPHNASRAGVIAACERSLKRMRIETIDLYLLHWRGGTPLAETVAGFDALRASGKIRHWGVSNFDMDDMAELFYFREGSGCAANQVLYNPSSRGIEFDLMPWSSAQGIPIMAYSPVGQAGRLLKSKAMVSVARRHNKTPAQIAIAWSLRMAGVISIPKASEPAHVRENAEAADIRLTQQDCDEIDAAFPPPRRKGRLEML